MTTTSTGTSTGPSATAGGATAGRWVLPPDRVPEAWFNVVPHLPEPLQPPLHPGHPPAGRARRPGAPVPDGPHRPGGVGRAVDRRAGRGARRPPPVAPDPARAGPPPRSRPRHPGPHLLQGRVGVAGRLPQAQHRHRPGLLQQAGGRRPAGHRDRRRPVGERPVAGLLPVRPGVQGLHGAVVVQPEALPPDDDRDVGRPGRAVARRRPRVTGLPRLGHQRRGGRRRHPGRHPLRPRLGAEPRPAAPDGDRPGGQGAAGHGRRVGPRRRDRLLRRRLQPGRHRPALRPRQGRAAGGGRAVLVPDAHLAAASTTTSATPWA